MRITKIKLAGFKSFVDPTTLTLPGNLTGIVGPNGCGKSNIIDALMWVMGESSAKHLRGDSMADVIFNGSNSRKPVGQASVDIVFDNSDGKLGGQYAGYSEIAIKRTVSRDGISHYFLNGTRCRRKDVTNAFLGTGLGARGGYSVIAQGMISRVIEAKPEELRGFLEEAAGISRYKERRHETENRMAHTRENIDRLNDIREEIEKQLGHLQRQAAAAERYQRLKEEERLLEAQLLGLRWRSIEAEKAAQAAVIQQCENDVEAVMAELRRVEALQTAEREAQTRATDDFHRVQSDFYAKSAEISRLEQALKHSEERKEALEVDLMAARRGLEDALRLVTADEHKLRDLEGSIDGLQVEIARHEEREKRAAAQLQEAEERVRSLQVEWEAFHHEFAEATRREHVEQVRLEHFEDGYAGARERFSALTRERDGLDTQALEHALGEARAGLLKFERRQDQLLLRRDEVRQNLQTARRQSLDVSERLHAKRTELETLTGKIASLRALQEAALGQEDDRRETWMHRHGLGVAQRLVDELVIEPGWERAVEAALRVPLGALCGDEITGRLLNCEDVHAPTEPVAVIEGGSAGRSVDLLGDAVRLVDKVTSRWPLGALLAGVYVAADRRDAESIRGRLAEHESVITPDGFWMGPNWAQIDGAGSERTGVLERGRVLNECNHRGAVLQRDIETLQAETDGSIAALQALECEEHEIATELHAASEEVTTARTAIGRLETELERSTHRVAAIETELAGLGDLAQENGVAIEGAKEALAGVRVRLARFDDERNRLTDGRNGAQDDLDAARSAWREAREDFHQVALRLESLRTGRQALATAIGRNHQARDQLAGRCADLESAIVSAQAPQHGIRAQLETALRARLGLETGLADNRRQLEEFDASVRAQEQARTHAEHELSGRRARLEEARLEERALAVRGSDIAERFGDSGYTLTTVVELLPPEASAESWHEQIESVRGRIERLGPINLAAIDEFTQLSERKKYLDQQLDDLTKALATLREAIHKIDRETRTRFKETFDKVNDGLKVMFPVLFGGGHAYLELTGDELLDAGVTVMARPPGKRNSTIHLLSGGEKALTAVAFVFAIFELNPAPFCLLDEVDAPLDDANVVRLCEMLVSMSERVQFICITHNKITMESATQLIGVTMQEAGVSRLVSVNMEEAVRMAATA